ncbi:MAG: MATE family efflux transporter [Clostridia bacterium]|nr:MATE family efflux transporter [Clostridia bacterium]
MKRKNEIDMTCGPFLEKILIFAVPLMFTGLLQLLYHSADIAVVGRFVGKEALAAVGSTGSLVNLFVNLFMGISMGSGVVTARHIGAKDKEKIHNCVHTAMLVALISGVALSVIGVIFCTSMLRIMNVPGDVIELASLYLRLYFLGSPAMLVFNFGASIIRATGDTRKPFIILASTGLINVLLNLFFVIVLHLGVEGVAIPTVISQVLAAVMSTVHLMRLDGDCRFNPKEMKIHRDELRHILGIGIPAGIQNMLFSVSNVIIQSNVNSFGSDAMAGIAAGSNFDGYIYTCTNAIAQTTMTFTSQNVGAKKFDNIGRVYRICLLTATAIGVIIGSVGYTFSAEIISIFTKDPAVAQIAFTRMRFIMPFFFFCSLMDVGGSQLRGMGKSVQPMVISFLGGCGIRLVWVFFILPLNRTLAFLYWSYPISWSATFFVHLIYYFFAKKKLKKEMQVESPCAE